MLKRNWILLDAENVSLGRLASFAANKLMGKDKPDFAPHHVDNGDFVVVINSAKAKITGRKVNDKKYYFHSGYPGGLKVFNYKDMMKKNPTFAIFHAVKGMLPKNKLGDVMLKKLKVYPSENHPHIAQNPTKIDLV